MSVRSSVSNFEGLLHFVKIPVMNPLKTVQSMEYTLPFYFFFKSYMSQEHWNKKNTKVSFQKMQ